MTVAHLYVAQLLNTLQIQSLARLVLRHVRRGKASNKTALPAMCRVGINCHQKRHSLRKLFLPIDTVTHATM